MSLLAETSDAVLIHRLDADDLNGFMKDQPDAWSAWAADHRFLASPGQRLVMPAVDGRIAAAILGRKGAPLLMVRVPLPCLRATGNWLMTVMKKNSPLAFCLINTGLTGSSPRPNLRPSRNSLWLMWRDGSALRRLPPVSALAVI